MRNIIFLIIDFGANDTHRTFSHTFFPRSHFPSTRPLLLCAFIEDKYEWFLWFPSLPNPAEFVFVMVFADARWNAVLLCVCVRYCVASWKAIFSLWIYPTAYHQPIGISILKTHSIASYIGSTICILSKFEIFIPDCYVPIKWRLAVQVNVLQCTLDLWLNRYRCTNQSLPG